MTRKTIAQIIGEGERHALKQTLGPFSIVAIGIGAIIGAGIFVLTGTAAAQYAGPGIMLSFVLAGVAVELKGPRERLVRYASGEDLLRKTPGFWAESVRARLEQSFNRAYRYMEPLYGGQNPYMIAIEHNLAYLRRLLDTDGLDALRRRPPVFTVLANPTASVGALVSRHLANLGAPASSLALN